MRLFFFPYAGGGPTVFNKWSAEFPSIMETWIAHYPGRGSRTNEPAMKELLSLVEKINEAIQPLLDKPFIFFGHSMGGVVAFELIRHLRRRKLPQPNILFVSACGAPQLPDPHPPIHTLPDAEFMKSLQELNGIPAEVVNHSELMELLLPTLRADFEAIESYQYISNEHPLGCPIIAFGGQDDPRVSRDRLEDWASHTNTNFKTIYFPGDHFFINTDREAIIASITAEIVSSSYAKR
ncbi:MAG: thioesterase [Anaerolineales bacterium]|nr:thioesterase [Anaerolineales bacterium]